MTNANRRGLFSWRTGSCCQVTALLFFVCIILISSVECQFGVPKAAQQQADDETSQGQHQQEENDDGRTTSVGEMAAAASSMGEVKEEQGNFMLEEDAWEIAHMVQAAREDPETMLLVDKMKREQSQEIKELKDSHTKEDIMLGMKQTMDDIKLLDVLFKDKAKAVEGMIEDSLIEKQHIKKYRKNPELLEEDTRRGLYFQFVSLAVAGDFI